ncbi:MAG TPA: alpha/beta fold hydrolase [Gemmatimonadales bacterium]|nr:alpha/beta fold hydrolase [Gemmatimonadales bacterium]
MRALSALLAFPLAAGTLSAQTLPAGLTDREIVVPGPVPLPGTLTLPAGKGPFPGLIIVHGSGGGDRDLTLGPMPPQSEIKPYRDLAWGLAQQGIVVLRYDKRTRVQPMWFANKTFTVFDESVDDAVSALALLRQQPEVRPERTFMIGHSLGGMVAPRIAQKDGKLAGIVLLAGATRASLVDQIERQLAYIQSVSGPDSAAVKAQRTQLAPLLEKIRALTPADSANPQILLGAPASYFLDLAGYDPGRAMRDVPVPLLVCQGLRDYQVTSDQLDDWLAALGPRSNLTVKRYEGLNHLFLRGEGPPSPADYRQPGHVDPQVIADLAAWITGQQR